MSSRYVVRDDGSDQLEYIGFISRDGDYTLDDEYLYFVDGMVEGPLPSHDNRLYVEPLGGGEPLVNVEVDFKISTCKLSIEDGLLIATEPLTEIRHELDIKTFMEEFLEELE